MFPKVKFKNTLLVAVALVSTMSFILAIQRFNASAIPNTPEAQEIIASMEKAYDVLAIPFDALDVNKLDEVFINDPIFLDQMSADQRTQAQSRIITMMGAGAADNFGYLTAMKAKRLHQQHGANLLKAAMATAANADHTISTEKWQELTEQNFGEVPYLPDRSSPGRFPLKYRSIEIDNDKAYVRYDDGPALQDAILVRRNGRWYVAGIIPINVHF